MHTGIELLDQKEYSSFASLDNTGLSFKVVQMYTPTRRSIHVPIAPQFDVGSFMIYSPAKSN
jgi:hypothetical protein